MTHTVPRFIELDVAALLEHTADMGTLAELSGVGRRRLHRHVHTGLTLELADTLAAAVGRHPCEVWPCWFTVERRAKKAAYMRRYRATNATAAEKHRRRSAAYYDEARDYVKAHRRAFYKANSERLRAERRARYRAKKAAA